MKMKIIYIIAKLLNSVVFHLALRFVDLNIKTLKTIDTYATIIAGLGVIYLCNEYMPGLLFVERDFTAHSVAIYTLLFYLASLISEFIVARGIKKRKNRKKHLKVKALKTKLDNEKL